MLPSDVGLIITSCIPASANASTTHCAAFWHSSGGYCFGSATDLKVTSSARSSLARLIRAATAPRRSVADRVIGLQVLGLVAVLLHLLRAVGIEDQQLALEHVGVGDHGAAPDGRGAVVELVEQRRAAERAGRVVAHRAAVVAERAGDDVLVGGDGQPGLLERLRELRRLRAGIRALLLAAVGDQPDDGQHHDDDADQPVQEAVLVVVGRRRRRRGGRGRGHELTSASADFQLALRNFRNNHGGSRPSSTVPARIIPTYATSLPFSNCDGGTKPIRIAAPEARKPTTQRDLSAGAWYPRSTPGWRRRRLTAAMNISRYTIRYTCVVITLRI